MRIGPRRALGRGGVHNGLQQVEGRRRCRADGWCVCFAVGLVWAPDGS